MDVKYYMRENTAGATTYDLETDFKGLRIISVDGLEQYGDIKNVFEREYVEENEIDVLYPTNPVYKPTTITMKFIIAETFITDTTTFADAKDAFIQYISSKNVVYWDTYRNKRAFMYRDGALDITDDRRRDGSSYIQITVKYKNTKGFVDNYDVNNLMSFDTTWNVTSGDEITLPFYYTSPNEEVYIDWGDGSQNTTISPMYNLSSNFIKHSYSVTNAETKIKIWSASTTSEMVGKMPKWDFYYRNTSKLKIISSDTPMQTMYNGLSSYLYSEYCFLSCTNLVSVHIDHYKYNPQIESIYLDFLNTAITSLPLIKYCPNIKNCYGAFSGTKITSIPNNYFDNCKNIDNLDSVFYNCQFLLTTPQYLLRYQKKCAKYSYSFGECKRLKLNKDIFCDSVTEKMTRFATNINNYSPFGICYFDDCFSRTSFLGTEAGEAPDLWNYYSPMNASEHNCFGGAGNNASSITNYADIPSTWGGTATYRTITITQVIGAEISPTSWAGNAIVKNGSNITFNITTQTGYGLTSIIANGTPVASAPTYTFTNVTANKTLTVTTGLNEFEIETFAGIGGTITPNDTVYAFESKTVTITPNTKYVINRVEVDGVNMGAITSYTFTNILSDHTVNAYFTEIIQFKTTWTIPSDNYNLVMPFLSYNQSKVYLTPNEKMYIDWGDGGSIQEYEPLTVITQLNRKHLYTTAGTYQISIWSESSTATNAGKMCQWVGFLTASVWSDDLIQTIDTPMLTMYNGNTIVNNFDYIFYFCSSLTYVCSYITKYNNTFTSAVSMFQQCFNLRINKNIFCDDTNERYTYFANRTVNLKNCFSRTSYTGTSIGIAPALWDYSGNITGTGCFSGLGNDINSLSNYDDIALGFGGSATYYTITINQAIGGYITPTGKNGNIYTQLASTVTVYITPLSGKTINDVLVNGVSQGAITSYEFSNVTANHTITAVFI